MSSPLPASLRTQLLKLLPAPSRESRELNELTAVLLQISLAIMLIFMIAFFLFIDKVGGEIDQLDQMKTQLNLARQQQLQQKVAQVAELYRERYALKPFRKIDPASGSSSYTLWGIIQRGRILRHTPLGQEFCQGAIAAHRDYANLPQLQATWLKLVQGKAAQVTPHEQLYLKTIIHQEINYLQHEIGELQAVAAAEIQEFLVAHPEQVRNWPIRQLLERINRAPDSPNREAWLHELHRQLRSYVYDRLTQQTGVPMGELK